MTGLGSLPDLKHSLGKFFQVQPVALSAICCLLDGILKQSGEKHENKVLACDSFLYDYFSVFPNI